MKHIFWLAIIIPTAFTQGIIGVSNTIIISKRIQTNNAPEPIGPYSQAIQTSGSQLLFISGQLPLDPHTGILYTDPAHATQQVMKNLHAILQEAGMSFNNVVKTTIYLTNMNDFGVVNEIYQSYFNDVQNFPARETVQVAALPKGACVEISMIASH